MGRAGTALVPGGDDEVVFQRLPEQGHGPDVGAAGERAESAVWPFGAEPQWEQWTVEDGVPAPGVPADSS